MIKLGNNGIGKIYLSSNPIGKAYLGSNLVYQNVPIALPDFYDKLIFDGTAEIQTDYVLPANCSIRLTLGGETAKLRQGILTSWSNGAGILLMLGNNTNSSTRQIVTYYDSASYVSGQNLAFSYSSYNFFMTPSGMGWGTTFYTYNKGNTHPTSGLLIGHDDTRNYTGYIETINIYDSSASGCRTFDAFESYTPIATFRPCVYNNEAGFWHVQAHKFYGNTASSGTLTVGNSE